MASSSDLTPPSDGSSGESSSSTQSDSPPSNSTPPPPPNSIPPPPPDSSSSPPSPPSGDSNSSPPADNSSPPTGSSPPSGSGPPSPPSNTLPLPSDTGSTPASPGSDALSPPDSGASNISFGSGHSSNNSKVAVLVPGLVVVVVVLLVGVCIICIIRRKKKHQQYADTHPQGGNQSMDYVVKINQGMPSVGYGMPGSSNFSDIGHHQIPIKMGGYGGQFQFSYEELAAATNGFSEANVLGQGGFGYVYKGVLPDKREVAVKTLKAGSGQGEQEFQAEVDIISRVHHRHLVSLVGYCISSDQRMLVYEYVPNKTLEYHLHGKGLPVMNWASRLRIAIGSAKGLAYLHEDCSPRIIHRDIKSANILLDSKFEAMVADFGLAKLSSDNFTHVSTRVMGTFGYLAPEYAASGKLTEKSDVFSFGIMLLEIITGRPPIDPSNRREDTLIDWARPLMTKAVEDGDYSKLVDPRLGDNYVYQEMARMVACANASVRHSGRRRPRMSQVMRALDGGSLDDLNESTKPGQSPASTPEIHSDLYDTRAYNADMMKFRKMISDDYTNEFPSTSSSKQ